MAEPVNFSLEAGEHIAVMGPNGGGKSCLVDLITGRNLLMQGRLDYDFGPGTRPTAYGNIVQLTFEDALGTVNVSPVGCGSSSCRCRRSGSPRPWSPIGSIRSRCSAGCRDCWSFR